MLVTKEQAKEMWCPAKHPAGMCIADRCMWWRWANVSEGEAAAWDAVRTERKINGIKAYRDATGASLKEAKEWADRVENGTIPRPPETDRGYCGIAGKAAP